MGLIKTAIMTGGAIYAVKKIAKTVDQNHQQQNFQGNGNQYARDTNNNSYPAQNWGPPAPPIPQRSTQRGWNDNKDTTQNGGYGGYAPQEQQQQQQRAYNPAEYSDHRVAYDSEGWQYRVDDKSSGTPPPY